jgi:hypothetical protein
MEKWCQTDCALCNLWWNFRRDQGAADDHEVVTALNMMPLVEAVNVPDFTKFINKENQFEATEDHVKTANALFTSLANWSDAMKIMREKKLIVK